MDDRIPMEQSNSKEDQVCSAEINAGIGAGCPCCGLIKAIRNGANLAQESFVDNIDSDDVEDSSHDLRSRSCFAFSSQSEPYCGAESVESMVASQPCLAANMSLGVTKPEGEEEEEDGEEERGDDEEDDDEEYVDDGNKHDGENDNDDTCDESDDSESDQENAKTPAGMSNNDDPPVSSALPVCQQRSATTRNTTSEYEMEWQTEDLDKDEGYDSDSENQYEDDDDGEESR